MNQYTKLILSLIIALGVVSWFVLTEEKVGAVPVTILQQIEGKTGLEKSNIIARAIEKLPFAGTYTSIKHGVTVEMENVRAFEGGIEVFARGWKDGKQLGFSKDGTVEWEKFRIMSPPFLVEDPNGTIIRTIEVLVGKDIVLKELKLSERPFTALREELARTIKTVGKQNALIILGKRGSTVTTCTTDEDQSTTWDGYAGRASAGGSWAALHDGAGTACSATLGSGDFTRLGEDAGGFDGLNRGVLLFNCSAIADTDTIDSADFIVEGTAKTDNATHNQGVTVASSNPASDTACANADYFKDSLPVGGGTDYSTDMDIGSWNAAGDNTFTINATGLTDISKTATPTKMALLLTGDQTNTAPSSGGGGAISSVGYKHVESVGGEPRLTVTHSAAAAAGGEEQPIWHIFMNSIKNLLAFR